MTGSEKSTYILGLRIALLLIVAMTVALIFLAGKVFDLTGERDELRQVNSENVEYFRQKMKDCGSPGAVIWRAQ